jgi:hypothetical protein
MTPQDAIRKLLDTQDYSRDPYLREAIAVAVTAINITLLAAAPLPVAPVAGEGIALGECCECEMNCCPNHEDKEE